MKKILVAVVAAALVSLASPATTAGANDGSTRLAPHQQAKNGVITVRKALVAFERERGKAARPRQVQRLARTSVRNQKVAVLAVVNEQGTCLVGLHPRQRTERLWVYDSARHEVFRARSTEPESMRAGACKALFHLVALSEKRAMVRFAAKDIGIWLEGHATDHGYYPETVTAKRVHWLDGDKVQVSLYRRTLGAESGDPGRFRFCVTHVDGPWATYTSRAGLKRSGMYGQKCRF